MSNECLYRLIGTKFTDMNLLICTATRKGSVCLPINIECRRIMKWELLMWLACDSIPNDCCLIDARRKNVISLLVPFERKNGSFMLTEGVSKTTFCCPYASITIIRTCCKVRSVTLEEKLINRVNWWIKLLTFQSSDVTSLLEGTSAPPCLMQCLKTNWWLVDALSDISQMRAVESPEPLASKSRIGFHAQMNTSLSWPRNIVALFWEISMKLSESGSSLIAPSAFSCPAVFVVSVVCSPFVSVDSAILAFDLFNWFCRLATTSGITASMRLNFSTIFVSVPANFFKYFSGSQKKCSSYHLHRR